MFEKDLVRWVVHRSNAPMIALTACPPVLRVCLTITILFFSIESERRLGCIDLVVEILIKKMNGQQRENWSNVVSEMDAHSLCTSFSFFFFLLSNINYTLEKIFCKGLVVCK